MISPISSRVGKNLKLMYPVRNDSKGSNEAHLSQGYKQTAIGKDFSARQVERDKSNDFHI